MSVALENLEPTVLTWLLLTWQVGPGADVAMGPTVLPWHMGPTC